MRHPLDKRYPPFEQLEPVVLIPLVDSKICYSIDWTIVYPARPAHGVKLLKLGVNIELFSIFRSPFINIVWISWLVICPCTLFKATSTKCILGYLFNYYLKGLYSRVLEENFVIYAPVTQEIIVRQELILSSVRSSTLSC